MRVGVYLNSRADSLAVRKRVRRPTVLIRRTGKRLSRHLVHKRKLVRSPATRESAQPVWASVSPRSVTGVLQNLSRMLPNN